MDVLIVAQETQRIASRLTELGLDVGNDRLHQVATVAEGLDQLRRVAFDVVLVFVQDRLQDPGDLVLQLIRGGCASPILVFGRGIDARNALEVIRLGAFDCFEEGVDDLHVFRERLARAVESFDINDSLRQSHKILSETNDSLSQQAKNIQEFQHAFAHELKNPLTVTREFLGMLLKGQAGRLNEQQTEFATLAWEGCDRMTACLEDLLDNTRLKTGKLPIELQPIRIPELVAKVVSTFRPTAESEAIQLRSAVDDGIEQALIDRNRIYQVLSNLMTNALKFTNRSDQITIGASREGAPPGFLIISVRDTGRGIEAEKLAKIFDPYYQTAATDSWVYGGLGLGLNICQQLVHLHGGEIWVDTEVGRGTTFFFTVPEYITAETSPSRPSSTQTAPT